MKKWFFRIFVLLALVFLAAFVIRNVGSSPAIAQPLAFNHRIHHVENQLECTECHRHAKDGIKATLPDIEVCQSCHDADNLPDEPHARQRATELAGYLRDGRQISWQRLYRVPDHVYFSHRRHTAMANIACETCHGEMGSQSSPPPRALMALTMDDCMECHRKNNASIDCIVCHK